MVNKKLINGLKYEKLSEEQLYDLSSWELVDIILAYRKDYKAKDQECEAYKMEAEEGKEINAELKAENENYIDKYFLESQKVVNLSKVLTKIKEICNSNDELKGDFNLVDCDKYKLGKHNLANRILQKISEVEDET